MRLGIPIDQWAGVFIYSLGMTCERGAGMRGCCNMLGLPSLWPLYQSVLYETVLRSRVHNKGVGWLLLSTDSSEKKMISKALTVLRIIWQEIDKRLMIPVSPLMIGKLVQPKLNDTPTLMFQGIIIETEVSSVKHLWPAGSHWWH